MKLTPEQYETIKTYIQSWDLLSKDFIDEIYDHFCTEIEVQIESGNTFDNAFANTAALFEKREYTPFNFLNTAPTHFGMKAIEAERISFYRNTYLSEYTMLTLRSFTTYRLFIAISYFLALASLLRHDSWLYRSMGEILSVNPFTSGLWLSTLLFIPIYIIYPSILLRGPLNRLLSKIPSMKNFFYSTENALYLSLSASFIVANTGFLVTLQVAGLLDNPFILSLAITMSFINITNSIRLIRKNISHKFTTSL